MSDIDIRITGRAGRITLNRPLALNALTYEMCLAIESALISWREDTAVLVVVLDAAGDRAFCSGGDIAEMYSTGVAGDFAFGRQFWRDEYRLNAMIFEYPKPIISFLQGYTMGGGVGVGCHGSHRVVGNSSQIAMPECGIGLAPDVGGTLMLALAPGRLGEYLATTAARMGADDAIFAGFADHFIAEKKWPALTTELETTGDATLIEAAAATPPQGQMRAQIDQINALFGGESLTDILNALRADASEFAAGAYGKMSRNAPLSMACAVEMIHRLRGPTLDIRRALALEYRFTYRAMEHGDFIEGIRAAIIDKDRSPKWQFAGLDVPGVAVSRMLMPLGKVALNFREEAP
jgi:3-hydroxyisobutyrate dehydrogenase